MPPTPWRLKVFQPLLSSYSPLPGKKGPAPDLLAGVQNQVPDFPPRGRYSQEKTTHYKLELKGWVELFFLAQSST